MIFVQKLPTLEPEMRDALRSHIIKKRQRLKQELEQDAIEKRLKREKELKQLQDAMTLDQIKEQLSTLEKRLLTLQDEKTSLFGQLKQVLNDDDTKRKQYESDQSKAAKQQIENPQPHVEHSSKQQATNCISAANQSSANNHHQNQQHHHNQQHQHNQHHPHQPHHHHNHHHQSQNSAFISSNNNIRTIDLNSIPKLQPATKHTPSRLPSNPLRAPQLIHASVHNNPYIGSPHPHTPVYAAPTAMSRQSNLTKPLNLENHTQFRTSLSGPMSHHELMGFSHSIDFASHRPQQQTHVSHRPLMMDIPLSLATSHLDMKALTSVSGANGSKRSLSVANLGDLEERSFARKRPNSFIYPTSNQFLLNGIAPHVIPSLPQHSPANQPGAHQAPAPPMMAPVPSSTSNLIHGNFHPNKSLPHQLPTNFEYIMNQGKPSLIMPSLNAMYPGLPPMMPPCPLYQGLESDMKHFSSPYPTLPQQFGNLPGGRR